MGPADTMANFIEFPLMDTNGPEQLTGSNNSLAIVTVDLFIVILSPNNVII